MLLLIMPHQTICYLIFFGILLSIDRTLSAECEKGKWECLSKNQCIDETNLCDGSAHCKDSSDETFHLCSGNFTCPGYAFRCAYGACVDGDAACDGKVDCADRSDELLPTCKDVEFAPKQHSCKDTEFPCLTGGKCISGELLCDGKPDCADHSDETITQCKDFPCPDYAFRCAYGACVDGDAPCDDQNACADGSDEYAPQCNKTGPPPKATSPTDTGPRKSVCTLPPPPEHGQYTSYNCEQGSSLPECSGIAGTQVRIGFDLHFSCFNGFSIRGNEEQHCRPGGWYPPDVPTCSDVCEPLISSRMKLYCFRDNFSPLPCTEKMPPNSFARFQCNPATYVKAREPGFNRVICKNGQWDRQLPNDVCEPACGRAVLKLAEPFISNGTVAAFGTFPWHAGIYQYDSEGDKWNLNCGGSLVSHNLVITAAHCFKKENVGERGLSDRDPNTMRVVLGKRYSQIDSTLDRFAQSFEIKTVIANPYYSGSKDNYGDDIALVILKSSVKYTPAVLPVCLDLGKDSIEEDQLVSGSFGMVAGWGITNTSQGLTQSNELLTATMPYVPREVCLKSSSLYTYVTRDKMCAGDPKSTTNVCRGDSGGGFVFQESKRRTFYLRGVVSLGVEGCLGQDYALFTRVSKHADFINKYL